MEDETDTWRAGLQEIFRRLSLDPDAAAHDGFRTRLDAKLERLEAHIEAALYQADTISIPAAEADTGHVPPADRQLDVPAGAASTTCPGHRSALQHRPRAGPKRGGEPTLRLGPFDRTAGPSGWWIITEVSVSYELHQCRTLIAYRLEDSGYRLVKTITGESIAEQPRVRIPPFDDVEMDLAFIVGE